MSTAGGSFTGAVLAGGEARRMGRNKALFRVDGEPLWRRQVRVLREAGADSVVVVRREGHRSLGRDVPQVHDRFPDAGPLAGVEAALTGAHADWVAVLAVDMPAVEASWFEGLRKFCGAGVGAVARHAGGYEPLAAIYPREALQLVTARLERGEGSMQALVIALVRVRRLRVVNLKSSDLWQMENWNTPGDRRRK